MDLDWQAVADAVRRRRAEVGLKQKELADTAGLDPSTVRNVEKAARSSFDSVTLAKISKALNWPADALDRISRGESVSDIDSENAELAPFGEYEALSDDEKRQVQEFARYLLSRHDER